MKINFILNGIDVSYDIPPDLRVIDLLREHLNLTGTKESCGSGECGSCTILVDGQSRLSCLMLAIQLEGRDVITIEGIGKKENLHPVQEKFISEGAVQCGFCTPGMVMSAIDLLKRNRSPDRNAIREGISGNICRCTGYQKIVDALEAVVREDKVQENCLSGDFPVPELMGKNRLKRQAEVFLPETTSELWDIVKKYPDAVLYSGGTDVLTKRRKNLIAREKNLVCIENIKELKKIEDLGDEIFIGSCAAHVSLLENDAVKGNFPVLIQALKVLGSPQIRHMGTIGGNICTASPAGDTLPALYALNAVLDIRKENTRRQVLIRDFIKGPGKTDLEPDEILYGIRIKKRPEYNFQYYEKVGQRNALSIAIASIAIAAQISRDKIIEKIAIAWGSVGPTIITSSREIENRLTGAKLSENLIKSVFPLVGDIVSPIDDIRAKKNYRLTVSKNLLLRILAQ